MIVAYFWTIKSSRVLNAIVAMGFDRFFLMADKNVSFHKSLGTGKGETFTPSDANALPDSFAEKVKSWLATRKK